MPKKYTRSTIDWHEVPFTISLDRFLSANNDPNNQEEQSGPDLKDLKQKAIERGFKIFTGIQLVVFIMHFAFGMKQMDIAKSLKANLKMRLKRMSKKTKVKSIIKMDTEYNKKKERVMHLNTLKAKQGGRDGLEKYAIKNLKLDKNYVKGFTHKQLASQITNFKLRPEYDKKVIDLMSSYSDTEALDKILESNMPPNITQPYVHSLIKNCTKKLKESFESDGKPKQAELFEEDLTGDIGEGFDNETED